MGFSSGPGNGYHTPPSQGISKVLHSRPGSSIAATEADLANQDGAKGRGVREGLVNVSGVTMLEREGEEGWAPLWKGQETGNDTWT